MQNPSELLRRLLRVVKLYRELSLLANRFLSTYAYMVMKAGCTNHYTHTNSAA